MDNVYLQHHGILGQKWGVRRYQRPDGTLTPAGKRHVKTGSVDTEKPATPKEMAKILTTKDDIDRYERLNTYGKEHGLIPKDHMHGEETVRLARKALKNEQPQDTRLQAKQEKLQRKIERNRSKEAKTHEAVGQYTNAARSSDSRISRAMAKKHGAIAYESAQIRAKLDQRLTNKLEKTGASVSRDRRLERARAESAKHYIEKTYAERTLDSLKMVGIATASSLTVGYAGMPLAVLLSDTSKYKYKD